MSFYPADNISMIHRAALHIAGKRKPVFPCKPNKAPYTPRGFKDASTDPGRVTALFTHYRAEKIGMPTGKASKVFVMDVDRLEALGELPGEVPETLTVRTPSGGLHVYMEHVEGVTNRSGRLPAGIDIRGEGGYVIVPPSKGYTIEHRTDIADAPDWLLEILKDEARKPSELGRSRPQASMPDNGEPIPDGVRDETLTRIAGRLHDGTRDLSQLEDNLQAVNEARCIPPLPPGQVQKIARSIFRYEPCRPPHREPDAETINALAQIERALLQRGYKGKGGKTKYSIAVAALKLARKHGTLVADGVRLEVSARQLAIAAAVSRITIVRSIKDMGDTLRPDNKNAEPGKSGALILLLPPARTDTTLPTELVRRGGCKDSRAPLTSPRLRWSSPARKSKRGVTPGTCKVRGGIVSKKRDAVIRLGKSCERVMDSLEAAGGSMTLPALAAAIDVKRTRELTRRKDLETGKGRDGFVTRLQDVGVLEVVGDSVVLTDDWLEALNRERGRAGEIDLYRRDMRRYNDESRAYRNRHQSRPDQHFANLRADGHIKDLRPVEDVPEEPPREPEVSNLARAIRDYLDRNPQDACQPPGWIGSTLWAYDLYPDKPTPGEVRLAIDRLGGEPYLRDKLSRARDGAA